MSRAVSGFQGLHPLTEPTSELSSQLSTASNVAAFSTFADDLFRSASIPNLARDRPPSHRRNIPAALAGRGEPIRPIEPGSKLDDLVDDFKRALIAQALAQSGQNHRRAASLLGIHRSSFTRMLHRLARTKASDE